MRSPVSLIAYLGVLIGSIAICAQQGLPQNDTLDANRLLAEGVYDRAEAAARDRVNTLRNSLGEGSLQVADATDILVKALILNGRATSDESLALAESSLRIKEAQLGRDHPDLASSLFNVGDVLAARAEFEPAILVSERGVVLRRKHVGPESIEMADALDHLGFVLLSARRNEDALKALEASLRSKEKSLEPGDVSIARTLEDIGLVLQRLGEYEKSGPPVRRAAAIQAAARAEHPAYARVLNLLAQQLWFEGQLIESRQTSERAVAVAERTVRAEHPILALSLRYLAATLEDLGDLEQSRALRNRALAIAERNFGPTNHETAPYLQAIGSAEFREGAYDTARQWFQRALNIYEKRYGPWHEYVAASLSMVARADASLGDYASARRAQSRVLTIRERIDNPNHPYVANVLTDMANTYREEGLPALAIPLLERALAIRERNLKHREVARTLAEMAATLQQVGRTTAAQAAATRALGVWERLETPNAPEYAKALALYAELQLRRGADAEARAYYERAMAIRGTVFGTASPDYADAQAGYALALAHSGLRASALKNAISAESTGRDHLRTMLRSLPERQSLNYAAVRPKGLDLVLSLALSSPEAAEPAMDSVVRSRAMVLDEMATRRRTQQTAADDPLRNAFVTAQQRLANLMVRGPGQMTAAQYATALDNAQAESERAEQTLAERSTEFKAERSRAQLGLDDVRAAVPSQSVLLSFVRYERTLFRDPPVNGKASAPVPPVRRTVSSYLAFVVRPHEPVAVVPLGSARAIDSLVARWREAIFAEAAPAPTSSSAGAAASRESGVALRRLIWDPVTPFLKDASHVFVVPDGSLSLVPFVALPVGQRSYLVERAPVIHYQSAERDLVPSPVEVGSAEQGLLAVGGPAFDDASSFAGEKARPLAQNGERPAQTARRSSGPCDPSSGVQGTFSPLGGTLREVRQLAGVWNTSERSRVEASRVLVGHEASEPTLKKEAHRYRVLHLATHGFFLGDSCLPARSGNRAVGGLATAAKPQHTAATRVVNPLLLSGLALAGANRRRAALPTEDDGILTAEEVASLDLAGVEWAVLSACDTGLGEIRAGEGVFGLRRAFQIAGARTVIMSLWSVDDQATREWMVALYEGRFQKQLSTAAAVHAATVATLRARRAKGLSTAPFYWAAFVAAGDWK